MTYRQLVRAIARWWWLGAIPVVIVGAYTALTYRPPGTTYQAVFRFTAGGTPAAELSADYDRYYAWLASEYIANGLADYAVTARFAEGVAERLAEAGLEIPPHAVQGAIATDNVQSVFVVYLTWPDPDQLRLMAAIVGDELLAAGPVAFPQMGNIGQVARLADTPAPIPLSPSLRARLVGPAIRILLGAFVGAGLILAAYLLDPVVRDDDELNELGLSVIAIIPKSRSH